MTLGDTQSQDARFEIVHRSLRAAEEGDLFESSGEEDMRGARKSGNRSGRIKIDIAHSDPDGIEVTVVRSCDDPVLQNLADEILSDLVRRQPGVIVKRIESPAPSSGSSQKRGGPAGLPENKRLEIVRGWYLVQGRVKETTFAHSHNISPSTLRRWIREFRQAGKL